MNPIIAALTQPTLSLRSVDVGTPTPSRGRQETVIATLEAQPKGVLAWIRRVCGFGRTITLMVTTARVIKMVDAILEYGEEAMTTSLMKDEG